MKLTIQPKDDYYCLQTMLKEQRGDDIEEIIVIPQDRIGHSGANLYLYYYKTKSIPDYYSNPSFFKIAKGDNVKSLEDEVISYKKFVDGFLEDAQTITGPKKIEINSNQYVFIASPVVGSKSKNIRTEEFEDLSVVTIETILSRWKNNEDNNKYKRKIVNAFKYTFESILIPWIGNSGQFDPINKDGDKEKIKEFIWGEEYGWNLRWDRTEIALAQLLGTSNEHDFINLHGIKCVNPLGFINSRILNRKFSAKKRVVHGDLHLRNIMVNKSLEEDHVYIIDFGWTQSDSHCLKDYCLLEFSLKFIHLTRQLSDNEIITFEEALTRKEFPEKLDKGNIRLIFDLIIEIRSLSIRETVVSQWEEEYLTSLLLITAGSLGISNFNGLDKRAVFSSITWISQRLYLKHSCEETLSDYRENRILDEIIFDKLNVELQDYSNIVIPLGDDCSAIKLRDPSNLLVSSTDPCPLPVSWQLGDRDYYHMGWYTVLINLSDIASMGATPIGILLSCVMNENMSIEEFNRFMDGASDCSRRYKCPIIGGNIKDGESFSATGTILGEVSELNIMERKGASDKDLIVVVGDMGMFWTSVLALKYFKSDYNSDDIDFFWKKVNKPFPKIEAGLILSRINSNTPCMDNSDGLTGCFSELSIKNNLDVIIDYDLVIKSLDSKTLDVAKKFNIDPLKLAFNWGDWQLVFTISESKISEFDKLVQIHNSDLLSNKSSQGDIIKYHVVGNMHQSDKENNIYLKNENDLNLLCNFENERFSNISYFTRGLDHYIKFLKDFNLVV